MAAGADGHLTKPISGAALLGVLATACEQAEARERGAG
jgi:CheY-like chemotaxis protein